MKILCVMDYFLPGSKGGGPITTLVNMRRELEGEVEFYIFTRGKDLGDSLPYNDVSINKWAYAEGGMMYYASPRRFGPSGFLKSYRQEDFDLIYLNSFFSPFGSIFIYFLLKLLASKTKILIAPRGEFSKGALGLKALKKIFFTRFVKLFNFYGDVFWHASTEEEARDILNVFPDVEKNIYIAGDPLDASYIPQSQNFPKINNNVLKLIFVSRISPKKNLKGLISLLANITHEVHLDIYGPIEDRQYWNRCSKLINALPPNIRVSYKGILMPSEVSDVFALYDLFAFPTLGENFGHVVFESLRAGTPVMISDNTPWNSQDDESIIAISLSKENDWITKLQNFASHSKEEKQKRSEAAKKYAQKYAARERSLGANLKMFKSILSIKGEKNVQK